MEKIYDIAFVSCGKNKLNVLATAQNMYVGEYFKKCLAYAKKRANKVYILSAKYGLLSLDTIISPYDYTLRNKKVSEKKIWSDKVITQIRSDIDVSELKSVLWLAGQSYNQYLINFFNEHNVNQDWPTKGLKIGQQMKYFTKQEKLNQYGIVFSSNR